MENNGKNNAFTAKLKFIIYFFVVLLNVTNRNESNFQAKVNRLSQKTPTSYAVASFIFTKNSSTVPDSSLYVVFFLFFNPTYRPIKF